MRGARRGRSTLPAVLAFGTLLGLFWPGLGAARELLLDRERSQVRFSIPVLWLFDRNGDFGELALTVDIDEVSGLTDIEAHVAVASVRMDDPDDVATLKSPEYFDAANHPYIVFRALDVPASVLSAGGELSGELSLRGVTRPVRFKVTADRCVLSAELSYCPFEVAGYIRRHDYGISARRGILGEQVEITIYLVPATPSAVNTDPASSLPPDPIPAED